MRTFLVCLATLTLAGCSDDADPTDPPGPDAFAGCTAVVRASADAQTAIQTALIEATAGALVCIDAGTFDLRGELSLTVPGVTVRGLGADKTILEFSGQTTGANGVSITSDGVTIEALAVKNTKGDGIRAQGVADVTFRDVVVGWDAPASLENGAYGLYPVGSDGVRIERCTVFGARDAGIYVGQSTNILVADGEVWGNVAGIEIENSTDAEVRGNHAHDNTAGILVFNLPDLPVQDGKRAKIHDNDIVENNLGNFAADGTVVSLVPAGIGVMILASDDNEVTANVIQGNLSTGVAIVAYTSPIGAFTDESFDPYAQGNWIHDNEFAGNGTDPDGLVAIAVSVDPVPDVITDGCEDASAAGGEDLRNCMSDNGAATFHDFALADPLCAPGTASSDVAEFTCEHEPLPAQDP